MDKVLQLFLDAFSSIGAFPYTTIPQKDSRDRELILSKGIKYYIWCANACFLFLHLCQSTFYLIHFKNYYLEHNELLRLIFHIFWSTAYVVMTFDHVVFSLHQKEVIQLVNGTIQLTKHLQRCKSTLNIRFCYN